MKNVLMFLLGFFVGSATILCFEIKGQHIREEKEEETKRESESKRERKRQRSQREREMEVVKKKQCTLFL